MRSGFAWVLVVSCPYAMAQGDGDLADLVRLAEASRLAGEVAGTVWSDWEETPFSVLLVRDESEWLVGYPRTLPGFVSVGPSAALKAEILSRPRQFDSRLLATFPAFGLPPVIVVGRAEATDKTAAEWVLTVLHEHFHQYQMSDARYYSEVDQLDLSGGDETGAWMLNYPFPYQSAEVADGFAVLSRELALLLDEDGEAWKRRYLTEKFFLERYASKLPE
jgi:hypothetical protein